MIDAPQETGGVRSLNYDFEICLIGPITLSRFFVTPTGMSSFTANAPGKGHAARQRRNRPEIVMSRDAVPTRSTAEGSDAALTLAAIRAVRASLPMEPATLTVMMA